MATDPYRYFRIEARELVEALGQGALELERGAADSGVLARLFRHAHTLKGAARVVRELSIAELSHELEEVLARARDDARSLTAAELATVFGLVDRLAAALAALDAPKAPSIAPSAPAAPTDEPIQTTRIEIEEMDAVLGAVTETGVELATVRREVARLHELVARAQAMPRESAAPAPSARPRGERQLAAEFTTELEQSAVRIAQAVERVEKELADVRDGVDRLRLVPAETLFPALSRSVRDAAQTLGKRASFEARGGALRLDAHVLGPLRDALVQLVRNAVAHGIELSAERTAAGKSEVGRVALSVARRGDHVVFTCEDDGRGVDVPGVRRALVTRGLASTAEVQALGEDAVLARLLSGGFSTATSATQIAGRGVGLDVVRETAARLHGKLTLDTSAGRGTRIELAVPVTLSALRALLVESDGAQAAIPLEAVEQTLRLAAGAVTRSSGGEAVAHGGQIVPFLPLSRALKRRARPEHGRATSAVLVAHGGRRVAIGVDRLLGAADVVVRPLPDIVQAEPVVGGASLDAEGHPRLVLDAAGLVSAAAAGSADARQAAPPAERLPILVIDDSLTTRMLEQSILESAGYVVELATSAEEGLEKAEQKRYGLFIVDVEMPGMNGFEFVTRTRAHAELARVPAILVSSRSDPEDFARGERAGASAYIVKGEFDQNLLLENIRKLLEPG